MSTVTLILCIENRIFCEGLKNALAGRQCVKRVRICALDQLPALPKGERDVVLIDIRSQAAASALVRTASEVGGGRPVVALGLDVDDTAMVDAFEAGAVACITSDRSIEDLLDSVKAVADGELVCDPKIVRLMQERLCALSCAKRESERLDRLSPREHHVLTLLSDRMSNKQIARTLGLEVSTIKNHVHNILVKLEVRTRSEAAALGTPATPGPIYETRAGA